MIISQISIFLQNQYSNLNLNLNIHINYMKQINEVSGQTRQNQPGRIFLDYKSCEVEGQCILLQISPIKFIPWRYALFVVSNIFVLIPWLITFWYPKYKRAFYFDYSSLEDATDFYVKNYDEEYSIVVKSQKVFMIDEQASKFYTFFINRYMTYIIDQNLIVRVSMYNYRDRISTMIKQNHMETGLSDSQTHQLKNTYGPGTMVIQKPTCLSLAVKQILRPLYIFLMFSVCYWTFNQAYYYFAGVLFLISSIGLVINLYQMIVLNNKIFEMAYYQIQLNVLREGKMFQISSLKVVPGDIVFLKDPIKIPFEGIILQGSALINQCALTGESVPIVKKADSFERVLNLREPIDKNAFVFEGTTIVQVNDKKKMIKFESFRQKYGIPVCVVRTNFVTTKGQLIRIILFPKQQQNIFQKQSSKYLMFLFLLSVGTYIVLIILIYKYVDAADLVQKFFDLITITVPPALPVSMTFGIIYAIQRLEKKKIFCISQNKVITGGMIQFCCFDKTGTLTQDFMDFNSLIPANQGKFYPAIANNEPNINKMLQNSQTNPYLNTILSNMASNNSIIKIEATDELIGDPMEIKAFEFGRYRLNQSHSDPDVIFGFESERGHNGVIYRRFEFDSDLQRMSVVCQNSITKGVEVYVKGSPQIMATIILPETIPKNYKDILNQYASNGFRVLAIASKSIDPSVMKTIPRPEAENNLSFNGFEVFENKLKPQSRGAIGELRQAQIPCVMITGDNTLTGSNISYKCDISNKNKKMIICDLVDGKYTEENFNFVNDDDASTQVSNKHPTPAEIQLQTNNNSAVKLNNKIHPVQVQLFPSHNHQNQVANTTEDFGTDSKGYMQYISNKAVQTNSQLCVTGRAFNNLFPGIITDLDDIQKRFMDHVTVFARTKPNDKAKIVMAYQHMDRKVSMCGDGANDCGALKQADIGLSLSQAQASISAPFTSQIANIRSMVELIKQCRGGLATNFSLFNIMAIYSLIQYTTTVIGEKFLQYPGQYQYLYWDLAMNFFFIVFIGYTKTATTLSVERPRGSLFCFTNMMQMLIAFGVQVAGQISIIAIYSVIEPDYYAENGGMDVAQKNYIANDGFAAGLQTSLMYLFINNIYVSTMIAFNIAKPWREYLFTNIPLMIMIILTTAYNNMLFFCRECSWVDLLAWDSYVIMYDRWVIFGVSWGFALFIFLNQKLILVPLSDWLIRTYPQKKWL